MNLGDRIRKAREERGLKQQELARRMSIHPSELCRYEKNEREPSISILRFICRELQISLDMLVQSAESFEHGLYWGNVSKEDVRVNIPRHEIRNGVAIRAEEDILTECKGHPEGWYAWVGVPSLSCNYISVSMGARLLVKLGQEVVAPGDVVVLIYKKKTFVGDALNDQTIFIGHREGKAEKLALKKVQLVGKARNIVLDL